MVLSHACTKESDPDDAELVAALRAGFAARPTVSMAELSKLLKLDEKTLLRHIRTGRLPFRAVGCGRRRITRRFTITDVIQFLRNQQNRTGPVAMRLLPAVSTGGGFIGSVQRPGRSRRVRVGRVAAQGGEEA